MELYLLRSHYPIFVEKLTTWPKGLLKALTSLGSTHTSDRNTLFKADFLMQSRCFSVVTIAIRCAYLHEGSDDISAQRAQEAIEKFLFVAPLSQDNIIHCNQINTKLQLQVDIICEDIKQGVLAWTHNIKGDRAKEDAIKNRLKILFPNADGSIRIS